MIFTAKIEQTYEYPNRMKYIAASDSFIEKPMESLQHARKFKQPYGWIMESGTPPCDHLDVMIMTDKTFALGDTVKVKIIGVFCRSDGDHKLVGVCTDRAVTDISELSASEREDLHRLYPRADKEKGEGWYGREKAEEIIAEFFAKKETMILPDYHIHTSFSPDSKMDPEEAIRVAIASGVTDICFTEHMDLGHHMEMYDKAPDFAGMAETVSGLRKKYPEINIGNGIEAGYIPETAEQTAEVLAGQNFDYVLLSTHCVNGMDCGVPESKRGQDKLTAYKRYLETVYESVTDDRLTEYYDCISHIGYIAKGLHYEENAFPYEMFPELFDKILSEIIKRGKGIEVNTSGNDRGGHVLPHPNIIRRYRELGGRIITIGSDAHKEQSVGAYIKDAVNIIAEAGFEEITLFRNRVPRFVKIKKDD